MKSFNYFHRSIYGNLFFFPIFLIKIGFWICIRIRIFQRKFIIRLFLEYQLHIKTNFVIKRKVYILYSQISDTTREPMHKLSCERCLLSLSLPFSLSNYTCRMYINEYNVNHFVSPFSNNIVITYSIYA